VKVGEAIARALVDEGIDAVFSLLGDGTFRIVYHLAELGIPIYEGRHEAYVYAMADGYSRATGRPTVCAITGGPALGHTFTAMTSAARTESSVLLLTGPESRDNLSGRQRLDHRAMTELTGATYVPVHDPGMAVQRVRDAVDAIRSRRTPAVLDVPEVVQAAELANQLAQRRTPAWTNPQRLHPDPRKIDEAVRLIESAERPVVLAGAGVLASGARDELLELSDQIGALLATTINARGLFHGHPYNAGVAGGYASEPATDLFGTADLVIGFGSSMDRFVTRDGALFPDATFVVVDVRPPGPMASGRSAECHIQGDARATAVALGAALDREPRRTGYRTSEVAGRLTQPADPFEVELEPGCVDPREVCALLDELLPDSCGWVSGNSGHFWAFPIMHMDRWRRPTLHASYFGAIGYGIPVGLGAALADRGNPIVVFEGDAGAMMHIQVVETAARYNAPLLIVVLNDGALGAEYHGMVAEGYDPQLSVLPDLDLAGLARQLGSRSATLTDVAQLPDLVAEFVAGDGPMLIDARVSRRVVSRPMRRAADPDAPASGQRA
jgi:thiamine pyrophosphate-dependent acetolactate synthase large subunit-like protein